MHKDELIGISKARIAHADDCLREAKLLLNAGEYKGAANRAYYAAFHALRAVLILDEFDSKKHSGIISKFRENYLKTELFNRDISDYISSLFRVRSASDYDDFYIIAKDEAAMQIQKAEIIIAQIKNHLKTIYS